jgi:formylglycine-generating enzyme required for sulfatase activity
MRTLFILMFVGVVSESIAARAADVEVVAAFMGNKGPGWKAAANVHGAVGPNHIVDFTVGGFTVHDKATGKVLRHLSQREFWNRVEPPNSIDPQRDANDPWMVYDPLSQRWFATASGTSVPDSFLAVSTSSDPMGAWKGAKLPLPRVDPGVKIGVDRNGLYLCSANGSSDLNEALNCYVIPKGDAIAPEGPALSHAQTFTKLIYAAVPAVDLDPNKAADAPAVLLNNEFGGPTCGKLYLYKIAWSGPNASLSAAQEVALSKAYPVPRMDGLQPPPGVRLTQAGGRRNNCAFVRGGSVFGCNGAKRAPGSRPGILWYEVRIRDGALLQEGFVDDPNCDYLYPSMAVDSKGNIGIGCTRTSEKEFPSVCVMMHAAGDPPGTMRAPILAVKGTTYFRYTGVTSTNFSNYSATCIDPSDPGLLWTYQGCANSPMDRQWCTAWAAFRMSSVTALASQPKSDSAAFQVYSAWPFGAAEAVRRQNETARALGVLKQIAVSLGNGVSIKFVLIPAGRFMMGSPGSQHEVTIAKPYYMAVYKVTQAQYAQAMGHNPSAVKGKDFPVSDVTWKDAVDFCQKASRMTGKKIHVPTEAQWENACRAGANTKFFWGDDERKLGDYCWYRENIDGRMRAVGLKKPNSFGLYDINGLMWETCRRSDTGASPSQDDSAENYLLRGATFGSRPPMFIIGVTIPAGENRAPGKGLDRCGMRVMMDAS